MVTWVYDKATSAFLNELKPDYDPATQGAATLPRHPDPAIERCDQRDGSIRTASAQEVAEYPAQQQEARAAFVVGQAAIQALGKAMLDKLDQAIGVLNQRRTEAAHTQRAAIPLINRQAFWDEVKQNYKDRLP